MEQKIINILKLILETKDVNVSCSQDTCPEWDSLRQLNLVLELENTFNISLEPEEISEMKSYSDIIRILKAKGVK
ncbi:MAG: acyl carrier protein [Bacteroidales bacterium]|jgi:acyl carrier protein|nr:acyl carrier protein [Bacteroidales bacterium]